MHFKRTIASCVISAIIICNTQVAQASNITQESTSEITEENLNDTLIDVDDLNTQINELYKIVADNVGISEEYVRELHLLAGGDAVYADKKPNIYNDETSSNLAEPMKLYGADTVYQKAEFIECEDDKIERPSAYYLPDAVYSVAYDIYALMTQRYYTNRDGMQVYFDSLNEEVKQNIIFYESVLLYTGEDKETVDNLFKAYEKILYDKQSNENVIEKSDDGTCVIKDKFIDILNDIGIKDETRLKYLAIILSFDEDLAVNDSVENVKDEYIVPYRLNYTSRENMMLAAMCLTGKVRYVWGGGHSGASYIDGINPVWSMWNSLYPTERTTETINEETGETEETVNTGYKTCIKPSGSWCPVHGSSSGTCSKGETIHKLSDYIDLRSELFDTTELQSEKYSKLLSKVDYTDGISVHTLDGLDCSGFASWLYNQITDKYEINSTAINFTNQNGIEPVEFGSDLLPGDLFTWTTHIVIIIGKVNDGSKAYVTMEQTPDLLRFGVLYYSGASANNIAEAKQVAKEANLLLGGITDGEEPHTYCMNNVGVYTTETVEYEEIDQYRTEVVWFPYEENDESYNPYDYVPDYYDYSEVEYHDEGYEETYYIPTDPIYVEHNVTVTEQYYQIGRFKDQFIDEDTNVGELNKPIKDMTASEIIQYTLTKLPISYVTGYNLYEGNLFDKNKVSSNLGVTLVDMKQDGEIVSEQE